MISIKNPGEIKLMRKAGFIVAETLALMGELIKPGITTKELDVAAESFIRKKGARPLFLGYGGFPATLCVSVNEQVIHGIPGNRELLEGDIVSIDVGAEKDGWCGDAAKTFPVGKVSPEYLRLLEITETCLMEGLALATSQKRLGDIAHRVQSIAEDAGYGVVRDYTGHGIGKQMHEDPSVPNYGNSGRGLRLSKGMTLAIEPMVNMGTHKVKTLADGWTVVTEDGLPSAHFEHSVAITSNGPTILTIL
ncbi:MAG: type I methionyl aminopeptidase [Clostridia bacterium]|jgi:methionyl aminopeptidase|nr:type I methionyl aminopeptidase [Clostridia bacterium]MDD4570987.1 type I methionyl aminopeptidase [Clostridia bacterium]